MSVATEQTDEAKVDTGAGGGAPPGARAPLSRRKKIVFSLVLALLVLGLFEIGARVYLTVFRGFDGHNLYQYVFDPYKDILPTPGFEDTRGIRHNSVGFRESQEYPIAKPAGTYRVFLMGASTAYGLGGLWTHIEDRYKVLDNSETIDTYLEQILADSVPGAHIEVINAAVTSTWTHHAFIYMNQSILKYDPDMMLFLQGFNDFFRVERGFDQWTSYAYAQPARVIMGEPSLGALAYANGWWLFRKSAAAHLASRGLRLVKLLVSPRPERTPMNVERTFARLHETFPANALVTQERTGAILQHEGIPTLFMLQPLLIMERDRPGMPEMERRLFDYNVESYLPNYEEYMHLAVPYIAEQQAAMAARVGADFLDLSSPFDGVEAQVYTDYAHLTPLGNELIAQQIAARILPRIRADLGAAQQVAAN